jgi:hypothetical protein
VFRQWPTGLCRLKLHRLHSKPPPHQPPHPQKCTHLRVVGPTPIKLRLHIGRIDLQKKAGERARQNRCRRERNKPKQKAKPSDQPNPHDPHKPHDTQPQSPTSQSANSDAHNDTTILSEAPTRAILDMYRQFIQYLDAVG